MPTAPGRALPGRASAFDEDNLALGYARHVHRAGPDQWVISIRIAHEAPISDEQLVAGQGIHSPRADQIHS